MQRCSHTVLEFGLSTAWNGPRHTHLQDVLREVQSLGFERVELYAHFTPQQLERAGDIARECGLLITSLHSPCPTAVGPQGEPIVLGDWLASTDDSKRRLAVDAVRGTIDAAARLGARAIVVHLGRVEMEPLQEAMFEAIRTDGYGSPAHRAVLERARTERNQLLGPHLDAAEKSARGLGEHARGTGVVIGLENRARHHQIPGLGEYERLFEACAGLPVGYWHDVGHAQRLENAGLLRHAEYLERYGDRLVGMHLHDVIGDVDHMAPGQGKIDYRVLVPYARPGVILTLELSQTVVREHIPIGVRVLRDAGIGAATATR